MSPSGWMRVARGMQRVAADGASRIASAVVSSEVATTHLPDLSHSLFKAGGHVALGAVQTMKDATKGPQRQTDGGGPPYDSGSSLPPEYEAAVDPVDKVSMHLPESSNSTVKVGSNYGDGQPYDSNTCSSPEHDISTGPVSEAKPLGDHSKVVNQVEVKKQDSPPDRALDVSAKEYTSLHASSESDSEVESESLRIQSSSRDNIAEIDERIPTSHTATADNQRAENGRGDDPTRQHLPEGSPVPTTRLSRAYGFASLGAGLALGSAAELARRVLGASGANGESLVLSNDANAQRLSESLRRMRGAAMKLGQMLSIQDESIAPPALTNALAQVRKGAEAMPRRQLMGQLREQWGEGWQEKIQLEERPFAAASIGQVHRGTLTSPSSTSNTTHVAVKVQYPGVADSIESDLSNLSTLVSATGLAPPGLFLDNVIRVGREELKVECDYRRELESQRRFQALVSSDPGLVADRIVVPKVIEEWSTERIFVTELVHGGTIEKVVQQDQAERDRIGKAILRLTMLELFVWRFMQTDPNWGNFLYDVFDGTTYLLDFGAAREYDEQFVKGYLKIVVANANKDEEALMKESVNMGFLTGKENDIMLEAHKQSGFCLGEPFQSYEPYNFKQSKITSRISEHGSVFLKHRLTPPPEEVYTLHRKLAGAYNLCIKLGANIVCRDLLDEVVEHHNPK